MDTDNTKTTIRHRVRLRSWCRVCPVHHVRVPQTLGSTDCQYGVHYVRLAGYTEPVRLCPAAGCKRVPQLVMGKRTVTLEIDKVILQDHKVRSRYVAAFQEAFNDVQSVLPPIRPNRIRLQRWDVLKPHCQSVFSPLGLPAALCVLILEFAVVRSLTIADDDHDLVYNLSRDFVCWI